MTQEELETPGIWAGHALQGNKAYGTLLPGSGGAVLLARPSGQIGGCMRGCWGSGRLPQGGWGVCLSGGRCMLFVVCGGSSEGGEGLDLRGLSQEKDGGSCWGCFVVDLKGDKEGI